MTTTDVRPIVLLLRRKAAAVMVAAALLGVFSPSDVMWDSGGGCDAAATR